MTTTYQLLLSAGRRLLPLITKPILAPLAAACLFAGSGCVSSLPEAASELTTVTEENCGSLSDGHQVSGVRVAEVEAGTPDGEWLYSSCSTSGGDIDVDLRRSESRYHTFLAGVKFSNLTEEEAEGKDREQLFQEVQVYLEARERDWVERSERHDNIDIQFGRVQHDGAECLKYSLSVDDTGVPGREGERFVQADDSIFCFNPASPLVFVVVLSISERGPAENVRGTADRDARIESFLSTLKFREPNAVAPGNEALNPAAP